MKVSELLIKARSVISCPEKWTQGAFAKDIDQVGVAVSDTSAVCFCSLGAIFYVDVLQGAVAGYILQGNAMSALSKAMGDSGVTIYNDTHTYEEVIEKWDIAIKNTQALENGQ